MRQRLVVVAASTVEVVRVAGGWLFDRAMAGWDVTVLTADHTDARPLTILGARAGDLESALASPVAAPRPHTIAVHADIHASDARVRRMVRHALEEGRADVWLWDDRGVTNLRQGVNSTRPPLSLAARAFKAQALAAVATGSTPTTELPGRDEPPRPSRSA
ncbi:MAG: hypothetical protein ACQSGP_06805 [Frankia sp.]